LGVFFSDSLIADIESLRLFAGVHEKYRGLHRVLSKRFPFAIYCQFDADIVDVVAVLDCRRDPETIDSTLERREQSDEREPE
jgi:hypothetical protein